MDFFDAGLTLSLTICLAGVVWRVVGWFRRPVASGGSAPAGSAPAGAVLKRAVALAKSGLSSLFSRRILPIVATTAADILLLARTWRTSPFRWLAHGLILSGFMGLLLFHAMDSLVTDTLFPGAEPTLDPWQFLRNLFGAMALAGIAMAAVRRLAARGLKGLTRFQDWAILAVVGGILLSGFFLEASKMISPTVFQRMTDEYFFSDDKAEMNALKAYWADTNGAVFSPMPEITPETLKQGASLNEDNCAACHSDTASAFGSRALARILAPAASGMDRVGADQAFWHAHVLLCFLGLAALGFGKFFHPLAAPANLLARNRRRDSDAAANVSKGSPEPSLELAEARRGLGLDACVRCGECSLHCSVRPAFAVLGNADILPSEKLISLKRHAARPLGGPALAAFAEGSRICTECLRCTEICPSGIDLQDLWMASKPGLPSPNQIVRTLPPEELDIVFNRETSNELEQGGDPAGSSGSGGSGGSGGLADKTGSFLACVQCSTCTSVCPVVAVSQDPAGELDLTPQQIMNMLRMGLKNRTLTARMIWSCATCYKCQEHCPQDIPVADILFELRELATNRLREQARRERAMLGQASRDFGGGGQA